MKKNDIIELTIDDMSLEGAGIGHYDGMTFFVKDAVTGDEITAIVTKLKKTYGYAAIKEIKQASPLRVEPRCALSKRCGGCTLQAMNYEAQLEFKRSIVANNLKKIGGFDICYDEEISLQSDDEKTRVYVRPVIGMKEPWNYRNKAQFPVGNDKDGNPIFGFYAARSHSIIPVEECHLGIAENKDIMNSVIGWMKENGVSAYDEINGKGIVRHVLIRKGFKTGEIMVCLVVNLEKREILKRDNSRWCACFLNLSDKLAGIPGMTSISLSPNTSRENKIMGDSSVTIWGDDVIRDKIGDVTYEISPLSFYQVNPVQTEVLYKTALDYAGLTGDEVVWDLYCGIGTISLFLAQNAREVHGVEIIPDAIENAKRNAGINGITNAFFTTAAAEDVVDTLPTADVIVVDPPRKGLDEKCIETIIRVSPKRIVYVSCDSATLARDLKLLNMGGYAVDAVQPVDQFCHTSHVETVCLLSRKAPV